MANEDKPHGLALIGSMNGGNVLLEEMTKDSGGGTAIFRNDVVKQEADGNIAPNTAGAIASGVSLNYGAASTETLHTVVIDPYARFDAQDNSDTDGFDAADRGLNCDLEYNAGDTVRKLSGHELDESTLAVTATLDVKLRKLMLVPNNEYGAFGRWEVIFNKHRMLPATVGV